MAGSARLAGILTLFPGRGTALHKKKFVERWRGAEAARRSKRGRVVRYGKGIAVIKWTDDLKVGLSFVDEEHKRFVELYNDANEASDEDFAERLAALVEHIRLHFQHEEQMMRASCFFAYSIHKNEHERVLAEIERIEGLLAQGSRDAVRAFLAVDIPSWFEVHRNTMDQVTSQYVVSRLGRDWTPE